MKSRYIPVKIRRALQVKFAFGIGIKCGFPKCRRPARDLHHTKRFSLVKRHLEEEIVPLCKIHHELAHTGVIEKEELLPIMRDEGCRLKLERDEDNEKARVDDWVQRKKMEGRRSLP